MSKPETVRMRSRLAGHYAQLRSRLTRLLGSADSATEALNQTWLQLDAVPSGHTILDMDAYLLRMAIHIGQAELRAQNRYLSIDALEQVMEYADELANTEKTAMAKQANHRLLELLECMPVRRRTILISAQVQGKSNETIAREHGVSVSTVERELRAALRVCAQELVEFRDPDAKIVKRRA